ncbi:transketolase [Alteraurantiacibacter aquimixticola]|uniref:Transketolase n=1 Tax=Alteraurantiacibacter aquimixticola TaxID=2489173 RepID=A0A4V4U8J6_9SPHN|nr:transketolase [Alteraurantiacibacter aquimixticola]TIX50213.1 transketolase [Alteraurantiacibacter aquimixticola]
MSQDASTFQSMANAIRALTMDAVQAANIGHPGMPMGMADVATVLYSDYLKFDPKDPQWPDRDRFVLSAGHGSMLIYSLLHLTGYAEPTMDDIRNFRQLGSPCAGHPENFLIDGVECTTGPLGQGLAMGVGMAIAERHLNAKFGDDVIDHKTWVLAGDGCLMEGINHEAIGIAGHLELGNLIVLWDDNNVTIDGSVELSSSEDVLARYEATKWHTVRCDGHDPADIRRAIVEAVSDPRPSIVACKTIIGKGSPNKQGTSGVHGAPLGENEVAAARVELGWEHEPFVIPDDIMANWRELGKRGGEANAAWKARLDASGKKADLENQLAGVADQAAPALEEHISALAKDPPKVASRKASEMALGPLTEKIPQLIGGSADLTGSNNTKTASTDPLTCGNYGGRYLYYGIREFGMAAAMNGMFLHGGVVPYGGTFLIFSDYARNAIRLSALQKAGVVYVMTHDSIGLGEDGPTHQPVEQVMSLRLIPNLNVYRPADAIETAECWALALQTPNTPSVLCLSRQNLPPVRGEGDENWTAASNRSAKGAYRLKAAGADRKVVLLATGSEVSVALDTAAALEAQGIGADVVSVPCQELFNKQDAAYKADLIPADALAVSIEAGVTQGWERYTGMNGLNIGLDRFGASAPAPVLFEHFGFSAEKIVPQILAKLAN